jgi:hypothetical protein
MFVAMQMEPSDRAEGIVVFGSLDQARLFSLFRPRRLGPQRRRMGRCHRVPFRPTAAGALAIPCRLGAGAPRATLGSPFRRRILPRYRGTGHAGIWLGGDDRFGRRHTLIAPAANSQPMTTSIAPIGRGQKVSSGAAGK